MAVSTLDSFSKSGPENLKKRRTQGEAGRMNMGRVMKELYKLCSGVCILP